MFVLNSLQYDYRYTKCHRLSKMARLQRALEWFTDLFEPLPFLWNLKAVLNTNSVKLIKYEAYKNKTLALRYCWRGTGVPRLLWASSHKGFMFLGLAGLPDRTTSGQSGPTDSGLRPPWWVEGNTKNPGRGRKEQEVDPSKKHTLLHIHQSLINIKVTGYVQLHNFDNAAYF